MNLRHTVLARVFDSGTHTDIDECIYVDAPDAEAAKEQAEGQFAKVHGRNPTYQRFTVISQYPIPQPQTAVPA